MTVALPSLVYNDPPELDHIVHIVSPGKLGEAVEQFRKLGFSVERGGVHADGLTQNALIVLTDGVYIEMIEFLDKPIGQTRETLHEWKERRSKHWWWGRQVGWTDWCLRGGVEDGRVQALNAASRKIAVQRASSTEAAAAEEKNDDQPQKLIVYDEPKEGGRRALSGKEIRWNVVFPTLSHGIQRGTYPFWCEDKTPRWWRVPTPSPPHDNLTRGLSALTLLFHPETFPVRLASLQLILSSKQGAQQGSSSSGGGVAEVLQSIVDTRPPPKTEGKTALPDSFIELYLATPEGPLLPLRVKAADDPAELEWLAANGEGLFEVEISVAAEKLPITAPPDGIERETHKKGYGRLRLHPMRVVT